MVKKENKMDNQTLYFSNTFFSTGQTDILNEAKEKVGVLDLKSAFTSGVDVLDEKGNVLISGKFPFMRSKWFVTDHSGREIGILKGKFALLVKKYEYAAHNRGVYLIDSEPFSRSYSIYEHENLVGTFKKINGMFSTTKYQLRTSNNKISNFEWVAVVMGLHAIEQRKKSATANSS